MIATSQERRAAIELVNAVADAIRDLSGISVLGGVPSGELYAHLSGVMSLESYQRLLAELQRAGYIKIARHLITWTGPAK